MNGHEPILSVEFFRTETGREPVREWLKSLPRENRKIIGEDIKTVQFGWPPGMPLVRKLGRGFGRSASGYLTVSPGFYLPPASAG
jgi:hypothetical protein